MRGGERDVTLRWLFFFSPFHLSGSASLLLLPHLRLPVHVTLCSLSFLQTSLHRLYQFRSSPFYSVGSSLSGRLAVLVKEGQQEGIFAEFVGSELVSVASLLLFS